MPRDKAQSQQHTVSYWTKEGTFVIRNEQAPGMWIKAEQNVVVDVNQSA